MIDITFKWIPEKGMVALTPISQAGKDWFEFNLGATPEDIYLADKELSMELTRRMLLSGLFINSASETDKLKLKFNIKDYEIEAIRRGAEPTKIPWTPDWSDKVLEIPKLDEPDILRLKAMGVLWNPPEGYPAEKGKKAS